MKNENGSESLAKTSKALFKPNCKYTVYSVKEIMKESVFKLNKPGKLNFVKM